MAQNTHEDIVQYASEIKSDVHDYRQKMSVFLDAITDAFRCKTLDIETNTIDNSIWNNIGIFLLQRGCYSDAEEVYKHMLTTIVLAEQDQNKVLHKGLALYNLGLAQLATGDLDMGIPNILKALEEDKKRADVPSAASLPAAKFRTDLDKWLCEVLDRSYLSSLKSLFPGHSISTNTAIGKLDDSEKLFLLSILVSNERIPFGSDVYTLSRLFMNLKNISFLPEVVLKKKGKDDFLPLVKRIFAAEPWISNVKKNEHLTHFRGTSLSKEISLFRTNLSQLLRKIGTSSNANDYLSSIFLLTCLLRNYTSHYYDDCSCLFVDVNLYRKCFEKTVQTLIYSLHSV